MLNAHLTDIRQFATQGGSIIWVLLVVCGLLWSLILERLWFIKFSFRRRARQLEKHWQARLDHTSWFAHKIREALLSQARMDLQSMLPLIKNLIALCPLLGLLGTVTGMVSVFDVIATDGTSDTQAMARGVYLATIPTMAGLVVAITGIYFASQLNAWAEREADLLGDKLFLDVAGNPS